jgi:hypothetical protein
MTDQSDVETALVQIASAALYPQGTTGPSLCGTICRVYRGWPSPAGLDADLAAGAINVSVYPLDSGERNTTRYPDQWLSIGGTIPSLTVSVSGTMATFGGSAHAGQLAGLCVDGETYVHATQTGDTPALVASALAAQVRSSRIVNLNLSTIAIPGAWRFLARTVASAQSLREIRRQMKRFRVICWCSTPALRDTVAAAIDSALAALRFIDLPDGTQGRVIFQGSTVCDQAENTALYRRDLLYAVEYATTMTARQPAMLFGNLMLNAASFIA